MSVPTPPAGTEESEAFNPWEYDQLSSRGRFNIALLLLSLTVSVAWLAWKYTAWQTSRELTAATIAWEELEPERARELLEAVNESRANKDQYQRLSTAIQMARDPSVTLDTLLAAIEAGDPDAKNWQWLNRTALRAGIQSADWGRLKQIVTQLQKQSILAEDDADLLTAQAWLALQSGDKESLVGKVTAALTSNPYHQEALILRSTLQSLSKDLLERNQARVSLQSLLAKDNPNAIRALVILTTTRLLQSEDEWSTALAQLNDHPFFESHYLLQDLKVLNAVLEVAVGRDSELSYQLALRASQKSEASDRESVRLVYLSQQTGRLSEARALLDTLAPQLSKPSERDWLLAEQALAEKDLSAASQIALQAVEAGHGTQEILKTLMRVAEAPRAPEHEKAQRRAIEHLLGNIQMDLDPWLRVAALSWARFPEDRASIRKLVLARTAENPMRVAYFFSQHAEADATLLALEKTGENRKTPFGFSIELNALLQLQAYGRATQLIDEATALEDPILVDTGRLMIALKTASPAEIQNRWEQAMASTRALKESAARFASLGDIAYQHQREDLAAEAYQAALDASGLAGMPHESIRKMATIEKKRGNTASCRDLIRAYLKREPSNQQMQLTHARLNLLLNENTLQAKDILSQLPAGDPAVQLPLALAHLKTGQARRALELVGENASTSGLGDGDKTILYAVLTANGKKAAAAAVLENIDTSQLLPEEFNLLNEYSPVLKETIVLPPQVDSLSAN